ncbi:MAG: hypothetical protein AAF413_04470 [Patescibacteria group bacterium]
MRDKILTLGVLCLVLGYGVGYVMGGRAGDDASSHDGHSSHGTHMKHALFNVAAADAPSVSISVTEDAKSGWNVQLATDRFEFTPESVNSENVVGEGHAHLYVDGKKVARLYGSTFHYPENFDGTREFRVTLNANDHGEYAVDGQVVEASLDITHDHEADDSAHSENSR